MDDGENIDVDLGSALERCSGDLPLLSQVVTETMQTSLDEQVPKLRQAIAEEDVTQVHFHAHSIKGASATVGFLSLSAAAKELDDIAKVGSLEGAGGLVDRLEVEFKRALEYFEKHTKGIDDALGRCGGDTDLFYTIAKEMADSVLPEQLAQLEEGVTGKDTGLISGSVGQMLDASETIGAYFLSHLLKQASDDTTKAEKLFEQISVEVSRLASFWGNVDAEEEDDDDE